MEQLFDFKSFVNVLRNDLERRIIIDEYEKYVEPLDGIEDVRDTIFYQNFLSKFYLPKDKIALKLSDSREYNIDKDLLSRLIIGSFTDDFSLRITQGYGEDSTKLEMIIELDLEYDPQKEDRVGKRLDTLSDYALLHRFVVYIARQLELAVLWEKEGEGLKENKLWRNKFIRQFNDMIKDAIKHYAKSN